MNSIRAKLIFGLSVVLLVLIAQASLTYVYLQRSHELASVTVARDFKQSIDIAKIAVEGQKLRRYEKEYFIYVGNPERRAKYDGEWHESHAKLLSMLDKILARNNGVWGPKEKSEIDRWRISLRKYRQGFDAVVRAVNEGKITTTGAANTACHHAAAPNLTTLEYCRFLRALYEELPENLDRKQICDTLCQKMLGTILEW